MALSTAYSRAGLASALFVVLGVLSPVEAGVLWRSADGTRVMVRNAAGLPVVVDNVVPKLPVSTTGGAGAMRAGQVLSAPGVSTELTLSRAISVANIARGLRIATGVLGPVGLIGLAYEGIVWATDHWEVPAEDGPTPGRLWGATLVDGSSNPGAWGQLSSCRIASPCVYSEFESKMVAECNARAAASGSGRYCDAPSVTAVGSSFRWTQVMRLPNGSFLANFVVEGDDPAVNPNPVAGIPATDGQVEASFTDALEAAPAKAGPMIEWIAEAVPLYDFQPGPIEVSGPSSVAGPVTTTTKEEGGNTYTTTNQTTYNLTYSGDTVTVTTTTVSTTVDASNNVVSQSTTTTQAASSPEVVQQPQEKGKDPCGLPGTPPCKIDETGTPTGTGVLDAGLAALTTGFDSIKGGIESLGTSPKDSLGMALEFEPPSGSCSPLVLTYKDFSRSVNWCPTLEVARSIWGWFIGILGALYVFRRATDPGL